MAWEMQVRCATPGCHYPATGLWLINTQDFKFLCAQCGMYKYGKKYRAKVELVKSITTEFRPETTPGQVGDKHDVQRQVNPKRRHLNGMTDEEVLEYVKKGWKK